MRQFRVVVNGNEYKVGIEELAGETSAPVAAKAAPQKAAAPAPEAKAPQPAKTPAAAPSTSKGEVSGNIIAAMPGTILDIKVNVGDVITRGQTLIILEAMKMENEIMASSDGTVQEIHVAKGASVNSGDLLMVLS